MRGRIYQEKQGVILTQMINVLILVITRNCNLNCSYCNVKKVKENMSLETAKKAINLFLGKNSGSDARIRFFGGEPLLNWRTVVRSINYAKKIAREKKINPFFDVTTNGLLLDSGKIRYFYDNPEIELKLSLDGDKKAQDLNRKKERQASTYDRIIKMKDKLIKLPNLTINMVVAPNNADDFFGNFIHIHDLGFKNLNILPAYYVFWPKQKIEKLVSGFGKIYDFIKDKKDVHIKNTEYDSGQPLYNSALVVDCNGNIFNSNLFLTKEFAEKYEELKTGHLDDGHSPEAEKETDPKDIIKYIKKGVERKIYFSTMKIDSALFYFVEKIKLLNNSRTNQ
jgi:sulfatase maturation enzyme AslB (radical SAM superfamily)